MFLFYTKATTHCCRYWPWFTDQVRKSEIYLDLDFLLLSIIFCIFAPTIRNLLNRHPSKNCQPSPYHLSLYLEMQAVLSSVFFLNSCFPYLWASLTLVGSTSRPPEYLLRTQKIDMCTHFLHIYSSSTCWPPKIANSLQNISAIQTLRDLTPRPLQFSLRS